MSKKYGDIIGKRFENIIVLNQFVDKKINRTMCECICVCNPNKKLTIRRDSIVSGRTKSCGCLNIKQVSELGYNNKKYNTYNLSGEYGIGYTLKGEEFYFDLEDYDKIKDYCWYLDKAKYILSSKKKKQIKFHRLILNINDKKIQVDHLNHNTNDNRKINLRTATNQQNSFNKKAKGYVFDKKYKKWKARLHIDDKNINLGSYDTEEEAIKQEKRQKKNILELIRIISH